MQLGNHPQHFARPISYTRLLCQHTELHPSKPPSLETVLGDFVIQSSRCQRQRNQRRQCMLNPGLLQLFELCERSQSVRMLSRPGLLACLLLSRPLAGTDRMNKEHEQ